VNPSRKLAEDPNWVGVRDWSVGKRYSYAPRWSASYGVPMSKKAPEEKYLSRNIRAFCIACHHCLGRRKIAGGRNTGIRDGAQGDPPWTLHVICLPILAKQIAAVRRRTRRAACRGRRRDEQNNPDRGVVVARQIPRRPCTAICGATINNDLRARRRVTRDAEHRAGCRKYFAGRMNVPPKQAAMALDALYIAYSKQANPSNAAEVRAAINGLFQQLKIRPHTTPTNCLLPQAN